MWLTDIELINWSLSVRWPAFERYDQNTMTSDQDNKSGSEIDLSLLSDVLLSTRLSGGLFLHAEFREPWCMASEFRSEPFSVYLNDAPILIGFHYLLEGEVRFKFPDQPEFTLMSGEAILVPRNDSHLSGSDLSFPPTPGPSVVVPPDGPGLFKIDHGGDGRKAIFICGFLGSQAEDFNPLIRTLPRVMKVSFQNSEIDAWVRASFSMGAEESSSIVPGKSKELARLSELLLLQGVKTYAMQRPSEEQSWLNGLRDRYVAKAMACLHNDPQRDWTLDQLAREVGLSKSAIATRFTKSVGIPPIQYLKTWRMLKAAELLSVSSNSIGQVAAEVGYGSYEAFVRAFKKHYGISPSAWRAT